LRRTTGDLVDETGLLYLPTGNPLPRGQSTIALLGSPRMRRFIQMQTAIRTPVRVRAEIALPGDRRKYSGAKLHRRKLIR
jgi:hypothetical protein